MTRSSCSALSTRPARRNTNILLDQSSERKPNDVLVSCNRHEEQDLGNDKSAGRNAARMQAGQGVATYHEAKRQGDDEECDEAERHGCRRPHRRKILLQEERGTRISDQEGGQTSWVTRQGLDTEIGRTRREGIAGARGLGLAPAARGGVGRRRTGGTRGAGGRVSLLRRKRRILRPRGFLPCSARPHLEVTARRRRRRRRRRKERRSPPWPHPGRTFSAAARISSPPW